MSACLASSGCKPTIPAHSFKFSALRDALPGSQVASGSDNASLTHLIQIHVTDLDSALLHTHRRSTSMKRTPLTSNTGNFIEAHGSLQSLCSPILSKVNQGFTCYKDVVTGHANAKYSAFHTREGNYHKVKT